jgi:hypothetical protein
MMFDLTGPFMILAAILLYFLPTFISCNRGHHQTGPIVILNLFLGWTLVGWVIALAWSCSALAATDATDAPAVPYNVQKYDRF